MPLPAETPPPPPVAPTLSGAAAPRPAAAAGADAGADRRPPSRRRRRRSVATLLAAIGGIVLLGAGLIQASGGLAGRSAQPAASAAATAAGATSGGGSSVPAPSAATSGPPPATSGPPSSHDPVVGPLAVPTAERARLRARLQATLDTVRARLAIPGASVTILFPDGSAWSGSSGLANVAAGTPVTSDTAFAFASMSKTFLSALIIELADAGRLRLTDSASTLLPPLAKRIDPRITVAMLLDHTSGLYDYFLNPKIDKALQSDPTRAWTPAQALAFVGKPYFPPGRGWHYSNTNYLLLGLIAERATGQSLDVAIRTRLLDPLALATIWYQAAEPARRPLAHGYRLPGTKLTARPIDLSDGSGIAPFRSVVTAAAGAGSLAGTSADLARWARLLYSGDVLGPGGTAVLLGGFGATAAYHPPVAYGLGIQAIVIDGHPSFGHSGRLLGFRGAVRRFPADGLTIAVLTNQSRADPGRLVAALLAVAVPSAAACPICSIAR